MEARAAASSAGCNQPRKGLLLVCASSCEGEGFFAVAK